ncbi:hypothetical protein Tsubulata_040598 [Turnera subulata]|uniref:Senescence regulator n=1 Tax=Turnera subulata TaxID=218843 RepID=A0A9Q0FEX2_9ROSI|nr:hypothetical protein Tsubulata_040598 [Turnera subulata]
MATSKSYFPRQQNYRFLTSNHQGSFTNDSSSFELDESDIYSSHSSDSPEFRKQVPSSRLSKKSASSAAAAAANGVSAANRRGGTPSSLPVNIPDWSKILKEEYRDSRRRDFDDVDDDGDDEEAADGEDCFGGSGRGGGVRVPPHEFLARQMARTRIASFSVHEGVGRTLKGRDLSRVRNAIWQKTGFED